LCNVLEMSYNPHLQ